MSEPPEALGDEFDGYLEEVEQVGDLKIYVGDREGRVFIAFSKKVKQIGIPPEDAMLLAQTIIHRVMKMKNKYEAEEEQNYLE
jgi:hypothetical protein